MVSPENWKRIPYYLRLKSSKHPGKSFVLFFFSFCRKWLLCAQNNEINYRMIIIIITVTLLLMFFLGFGVCFSNRHKATQPLSRVWLCLPWLLQNSYEFILLDPQFSFMDWFTFFTATLGTETGIWDAFRHLLLWQWPTLIRNKCS